MSGSSEGAAAAGMPTSTQHQLAGTGSPVSEPGQPAGPKQPKTRSRMGCMTCRKRKHKCGEERIGPPDRPTCERCLQGGFDCVWPTKDQLPKGRAPRPSRSLRARGTTSSSTTPAAVAVRDGLQQQPSFETFGQLPVLPMPPPSTSSQPFDAPLFAAAAAAAAPSDGGSSTSFVGFGAQAAPSLWSTNATAGPSTFSLPLSPLHDTFFGDGDQLSSSDGARVFDLGADGHLGRFDLGHDVLGPTLGQPSGGAFSTNSAWLEELPPFALDGSGLSPAALPPEALQQLTPSPFAPSRQARPWNEHADEDGRSWLASPPRYVTPTPILELLYSNPEERSLIQHFMSQLPVIFVGRPPSSRGTFSLPNAFLLRPNEQPDLRSFLPYLDIPHFLTLPRGSSTGNDALAMAIMSSSAIHLAHLHHTNGLRALADGDDAAVARSAAGEAKYAAVGRSMVKVSQALVRTSLDLAQLSDASAASADEASSDELTRLLTACSFSVLTDCISGGNSYQASLDLAREVIGSAGGARKMLATLASSVASTTAVPSSAPSRRRLRLLRACMEELVSWELVTGLSKGSMPTHFAAPTPAGAAGQDSLQDWFFSFSPPSGSRDMTGVDWETVETTWGTSRPLMELFARINAICATARSDPASALNRVTAAETLVEIRIRKADLLRAFPELTRSPFPPYEAEVVLEEAEEYRRRIKYGKLGVLDDLAYFERRRAKRLEFGDLLWCLAFELMLRVDVLGEPSDGLDIRATALRIVELVRESHVRNHVQVGLAWPTVIAGALLSDEESRGKVRAALDTFRAYCLYELDQGAKVLNDFWALRDAGDMTTTWRDVAGKKGFALV